VDSNNIGIVREFFEYLVERVHNGPVGQASHRRAVRGDIDMPGAGNRIFPEIIDGRQVLSLVDSDFSRRKRCCRPGFFALLCREERKETGNKNNCHDKDKDNYPQFSLVHARTICMRDNEVFNRGIGNFHIFFSVPLP
jgi:hypothetical protein